MRSDDAIYYELSADGHVYRVKLAGGVGVPIANGVPNGDFAGQDDKYVYSTHSWGSSGALHEIVK